MGNTTKQITTGDEGTILESKIYSGFEKNLSMGHSKVGM